jgi:hypothetical protein
MQINNPTTFSTPDLTLTTANSSGTAGALRADDSILVYDTTIPAEVTTGSSTTGSAATSARRDHVHGIGSAAPVLTTTELSGSRTASAGAGDQAVTGAGFQPVGLIMFACDHDSNPAAWGFADDALAESSIASATSSSVYTSDSGYLGSFFDGSDQMNVVLKSFDADGFTLTWGKSGSGLDILWNVMCFR